MNNINTVSGKCIVITGAGGVLCGEIARGLARAGAKLALLDIRKEAADEVANSIVAEGGQAIGLAADVLSQESLEEARAKVEEKFGPCEVLINGAGGNHPKGTTTKEFLFPEDLQSADDEVTTFYDLKQEGIDFVFGLNFMGTLLPSQVFTKSMAEKESGVVINISSMNALTPLTKIPAYSAAKAAVSNFTQWLAVHLSKVGIRVNAIAPGFFLTAQNEKLLIQDDGSLTPRSERILDHTPMGRFGKSEELIGPVLFLIDEKQSSFINGVVLPIDGGFSAYSGV